MLTSINQKYWVSGNEIKTYCLSPDHTDNNPSYFINTDTLVSYCFSCGYAPHPRVLFNVDDEDVDELIRNAKYSSLVNSYKEKEDKGSFVLPPVAYEIDRDWRGVSLDILRRLGVYYCNTGRYSGRLVFPIYKGEELLGLDSRIVNPAIVREDTKDAKWLRAKGMEATSIVYPWNFLKTFPIEARKHIILTEGIMDALSYIQLGALAIPTFGLGDPTMDRISQLLELGVDTVTIGYDNDIKGQEAIPRVYKHYIKWFNVKGHPLVSKVRNSGHKDCNDYLQSLDKST